MLCYILFVCLLGVPLLCAEFCMGRGTRNNVLGAYRSLERGGHWHKVGYLGIVASMMILSFYSVVAGWTLEYLVQSVGSLFSAAPPDGHTEFANLTTGWRPVLWTILFLLVNYGVMAGGVTHGIERMSNVLMPVLFAVLVAFCINSCLLPGFGQGAEFLFKPDFCKITPGVLLSAMGQAFFSLSLGLGGMMTYASYFSDLTRLGRTAGITAGLDTMVAILAGVMIFPAVFTYGLSPQAGPTLVFEVLPLVFTQLPGGPLWAILFFLLLVIASLTSTVSMSEIGISYFCEEKRYSRPKATVVSMVLALAGGALCALSFGPLKELQVGGKNIFDIFDYTATNILLPIGGLVCCLFVGWKVDHSYLVREFDVKTKRSQAILRAFVIWMRWVCPAAILIIFLNTIGLL